jgi:hypothetical protein
MDPLSQTLKQITGILNAMSVRYAIGGSLASSARSIWRSTMDVDLVADIHPAQAEELVRALGKDWYADLETVRKSILAGRSFNIIHMQSVMKVDVFPARDAFHQAQLERATVLPLAEALVPCAVTTAEDILLAKLRWYADGGEVSDRQWNDIVGLITINPAMDLEYVRLWAGRLGVTRLLERAQAAAAED